MKMISLSNSSKVALVDDDDFEMLMQHQTVWCAIHKRDKKITGVLSRSKISGDNVYMHRVILGLNKFDNRQADHVNGDPLNNQAFNLRIVSQNQNMMNKRAHTNGSSKFKGVSWTKNICKWIAQIRKDNKLYNLGYYTNEVDAATAYNNAAIKLFGVYAKLNTV